MKKLILLLLLFTVLIFASCDGKDRARTTLDEKIDNKDLPTSFFEKTEYFPKEYFEIETDTILDNGIRVYVKNYLDENSTVLNKFTSDTISYNHYYRDTASEVVITKDDEIIYEQNFNKDFFIKNDITLKDYFRKANFNGIVLNQDKTTTHNSIFLEVFFCIPDSDISLEYALKINNKGDYSLKEVLEDS